MRKPKAVKRQQRGRAGVRRWLVGLLAVVVLVGVGVSFWRWHAGAAWAREAERMAVQLERMARAAAGEEDGANASAGAPSLGEDATARGAAASGAELGREPVGPWAESVPGLEAYRARLDGDWMRELEAFREENPQLDLTEHQAMARAGLALRTRYGVQLDSEEAQAYTAQLRRWEALQRALLAVRAELVGIALGGVETTAEGVQRGFMLLGFDGLRPVYSYTQNAAAAESTGVNLVRQNPDYDPDLATAADGDGLYVNVNDHGTIYEHAEFQLPEGGSRIVMKEEYDAGARDHMTHVAGTVAAWGYDNRLTGMAPRVWIRSLIQQSMSDITGYGMQYPGQLHTTAHPLTGAMTAKSVMGTTSLGSTDENTSRGVYTYWSRALDTALADTPYYTHFYAASNDGSAYATLGTDWPIAKNVITIGAVGDVTRDEEGNYTSGGSIASFSSRGPTYDGRIKPDLTANGVGLLSPTSATGTGSKSGTSMATPNASGSATLLIDYIRKKLPGHYLRSSTLKALLVNTATDRGAAGPDYTYGWGLINIKAAADRVKRHAAQPRSGVLVESELAEGGQWTAVYRSDGSLPIRVSVAWLDPAGVALSSSTTDRSTRLVNNLNLRIRKDGATWEPYVMPFVVNGYNTADYGAAALTGDNTTDPVEQVYIAAPEAGDYTVEITHTGGLQNGIPQAFSLVVSGMEAAVSEPIDITAVEPALWDGMVDLEMQVQGSGFGVGYDILLRREGQPEQRLERSIATDTRIRAWRAAGLLESGYWDVVVRAPDGVEAVQANALLVPVDGVAGSEVTLYSNDFETAEGLSSNGGWMIGPPGKGAYGGPDAAYEGSAALTTYAGALYPDDVTVNVTLPVVSTIGYSALRLEFQEWVGLAAVQTGSPSSRNSDYAYLQYAINGGTWQPLAAMLSAREDAGWRAYAIDLPLAAENVAALQLRCVLQTDSSGNSHGWSIDNLRLSGIQSSTPLPPVFDSQPVTSAQAGEDYAYTAAASDADTQAGQLSFAATGLPDGLALQPQGDGTAQITGQPSAAGSYAIALSVSDGLYTTQQHYTLEVAAPQAESYDTWIATHSGLGGLTAPGDDPDQDGMLNLMEYALGGDPALAADAQRLPTIERVQPEGMEGAVLRIRFTPARVDGLQYRVIAAVGAFDSWQTVATLAGLEAGVPAEWNDSHILSAQAPRILRLAVDAVE